MIRKKKKNKLYEIFKNIKGNVLRHLFPNKLISFSLSIFFLFWRGQNYNGNLRSSKILRNRRRKVRFVSLVIDGVADFPLFSFTLDQKTTICTY